MHYLILLHVLAGIVALIAGALAIVFRKKTPLHRRMGQWYFATMSIIFVTGVYLSLVRERVFFFLIAFFTYYATVTAYRALKLKQLHQGQKPTWLDWGIEALAALTSLGFVGYALWNWRQDYALGSWVPLVFGCIGCLGVFKNVRRFLKPPSDAMHWLRHHIGNMLGSYIGAITAFVVNQSDYIPLPGVVLWLGPTALIVPLIVREVRKYKQPGLDQAVTKNEQ